MERSQSCTQFQAEQQATATKAIRFHLMKQKSASGNSMNINQQLSSCTELPLPSLNGLSLRRKRKMLQRQQSREYADDDMDYEYAADHEDADADEDEEDDDEVELDEGICTTSGDDSLTQSIIETQIKRRPILQPLTLKKTMQFQRRKPNSNGAIFMSAISLPSHILPAYDYNTPIANYCSTLIERPRRLRHEESFDSSSSTGIMSVGSPVSGHRQFSLLKRDNSIHSDSSRYSSVDSLLEARKPDPEAILLNLGFGPVGSEDILSRIPKRFLKPSQVRGNDTEAFVRRLQLASSLADHSVLGYRGLTGNPDMPPSSIVAKIMRRFEVNERKKSMACIEHTIQ